MKKIAAIVILFVMALSLFSCSKSEEAKLVDELIADIGTVSVESADAVASAENAYNALSDEQKQEVENYSALVEARQTLDKLIAEKKAAEEAAAKAEKQKQQQKEADAVCELIKAIGTVSIESSKTIEDARAAYNTLDAEAKKLVENENVLKDAKAEYKRLKKAEAEKLLANLRVENDEVRNLKFYYPMALPYYSSYGYWAADIRSFVLPYIGIQGDNVWMRMLCHYTADDWLFFEKITFAVDEERYYKYFSYYDVVRDNEYGDIWETGDIEVGESELEILRAIADSEKTIVRFEGDEYYDDIVISASDKQAIKEMLQIYDALK